MAITDKTKIQDKGTYINLLSCTVPSENLKCFYVFCFAPKIGLKS